MRTLCDNCWMWENTSGKAHVFPPLGSVTHRGWRLLRSTYVLAGFVRVCRQQTVLFLSFSLTSPVEIFRHFHCCSTRRLEAPPPSSPPGGFDVKMWWVSFFCCCFSCRLHNGFVLQLQDAIWCDGHESISLDLKTTKKKCFREFEWLNYTKYPLFKHKKNFSAI